MGNLIHNERRKLIANNLDRASTAALVTGIVAPTSAFAVGQAQGGFSLAASVIVWLFVAFGLHYLARQVLGGLRE